MGNDTCVGLAKRHMEEIESRGWADSDSTVCSACVHDEALVAAVVDYGGTGVCNFCGATPPVASAPLEVILDLVVNGIRFEYEDPIEQSVRLRGWLERHKEPPQPKPDTRQGLDPHVALARLEAIRECA